jgi:hypothetical protein
MGAAELLHSLKKFYSAPRRYTDFVFQRSVFMAERAETMDASIHDALKGPNILDGIPYIAYDGANYRIPRDLHEKAAELTYEQCMDIIKNPPAPKKRTAAKKK